MEEEGLTPSPPADREILLRRVTLDLTGLPPSLEEIDAFLLDSSPNAYEKVVDRLLASPRYGEHMARYWLDAARYGDTHGLHLDNYREIWPYRDWVVRRINENLPFSEFLTDQLAGDLLPNPSVDQLVATGFNRCNVTTSEGGAIPEEFEVRNAVDRVVTTGTVFMGLTLDCTRCHDHKYDPLTMDDFYSLYAYFNSLDGEPLDGNRKDHPPVVRVPSKEQVEQLSDLERKIIEVEAKLRQAWPAVDAQQRDWQTRLHDPERAGDSQECVTLGTWYAVGPFRNWAPALFGYKVGPEADLSKPFAADEVFDESSGRKLRWQWRPDWRDGVVHKNLPAEASDSYLFRRIHSPCDRKLTVARTDRRCHDRLSQRQASISARREPQKESARESVELSLTAGENRLLIKVVNYRGASEFYFARMRLTSPFRLRSFN